MSGVPMSMDDNNPTQDNHETESHPSHPEEDSNAWARAIGLSATSPNRALVEAKIDFGRRSNCHVVFKHPAISGLHCSLQNHGDAIVRLTDHSTNGTFVNGLVVGKGKSVMINDGDEIVLIKSPQDRIGYKIVFQENRKLMNEAEKKYKLGEALGNGAFAIVRRCIDRQTGQSYAMKVIDKKKFYQINSSKRSESLLDEVKILRSANHPGIIKLYDLIETESTLYICLELVEGGDLFDRIVAQEGKGFPEEVARDMFGQMLQALKYLHGKSIIHRDLKPENILMVSKSSNEIRISDFGLSRVLGVGSFMKTMCGTPQYLAPEVLIESTGGAQAPRGYDKAVDLWSLGCILYIILSGLAPFSAPAHDPNSLQTLIKSGRFSFPNPQWSRVSSQAKDLVTRLLQVDPKQRATIEQAESHPWMNPGSSKRKEAPSGAEVAGSAEKRRTASPNGHAD